MKKQRYPAGLPLALVAGTALPAGYDGLAISLRRSILNARGALAENDRKRRRMLRAAIGGLVDEAFDDAAANLTERLYQLATEDDDQTGDLSDEDLTGLDEQLQNIADDRLLSRKEDALRCIGLSGDSLSV